VLQLDPAVECRLPPKCEQHAVRSLRYDHLQKVTSLSIGPPLTSPHIASVDCSTLSRQYPVYSLRYVVLLLSTPSQNTHLTSTATIYSLVYNYPFTSQHVSADQPSSGECYTLHYVCGSLLCTDYIYINI
jgi:hypothetical protein